MMRGFGERCRARSGSAVWVALLLCLWTIPESAVAEPRSTSLAKIVLRTVTLISSVTGNEIGRRRVAVVDGKAQGCGPRHVRIGGRAQVAAACSTGTENTLGSTAPPAGRLRGLRWPRVTSTGTTSAISRSAFRKRSWTDPSAMREVRPRAGAHRYGSSTGLTPARTQLWNQWPMDQAAPTGGAIRRRVGGRQLRPGDQDDLRHGVAPGGGEGGRALRRHGWFGGSRPPDLEPKQCRHRRDHVLGHGFGAALVAGTSREAATPSAIWIPRDQGQQAVREAGAVEIISGAMECLTAAGSQVWSQNSAGIAGRSSSETTASAPPWPPAVWTAARTMRWRSVSLSKRVGKHMNAGAVNVIYGSPAGLRAAGDQVRSQSSRGIRPRSEEGDEFGSAMAIVNFGRDVDGRSYADSAVGAYGESVGRVGQAGAATASYGAADGLRSADSEGLSQRSAGVPWASPKSRTSVVPWRQPTSAIRARRPASTISHSASGAEVAGNGYDPNGAVTVVNGGARTGYLGSLPSLVRVEARTPHKSRRLGAFGDESSRLHRGDPDVSLLVIAHWNGFR